MRSPELTTERLHLRRYTAADEAWNVRMLADERVMRHVEGGARDEAAARALFGRIFSHVYAEDAWDVWAVEERASGAIVGHAEVKPRRDERAAPGDVEVVYLLLPHAWGRGYATELLRALVARARELGAPRVVATIAPENAASVRVAEKVGFTLVERDEETLVYVIACA